MDDVLSDADSAAQTLGGANDVGHGQTPSLFQQFELGAAGLVDLATLHHTHLAASVYANQESAMGHGDKATLKAQATAAEDSGALEKAADKTASQVAAKVGGVMSWLPWVLGGLATLYVGVAGWRFASR